MGRVIRSGRTEMRSPSRIQLSNRYPGFRAGCREITPDSTLMNCGFFRELVPPFMS